MSSSFCNKILKKCIDKLGENKLVDKLYELHKEISLIDEAISVSDLNRLAKALLENNMPICWIKGEVSGLRTYTHLYFDLKDEGAKVSCVLFALSKNNLDFKLENGQKIEVRGRITIYPQNGSYQINVERIRKIGVGELWEAYHLLISKLQKDGLFELKFKKSLPLFPRKIGVITSKEGAVIRDVITTLKRRMSNIPIVIYHTSVQGSEAAMQITNAIRCANRRNEVDVLIVCRGGGSQEDLWCFNEEVVAREVFDSHIPIISAVGHETDTTIIDFVADLRAATPTAAAELVAKSRIQWLTEVTKLQHQLNNKFSNILNLKAQYLDLLNTKLRLLSPLNQLYRKMALITKFKVSLNDGFKKNILDKQLRLKLLASKLYCYKINTKTYYSKVECLNEELHIVIGSKISHYKRKLEFLSRELMLLNPKNILNRGYSIVQNTLGEVIYNNEVVEYNEELKVILAQGELKVKVVQD